MNVNLQLKNKDLSNRQNLGDFEKCEELLTYGLNPRLLFNDFLTLCEYKNKCAFK